MPSAKPPAPFEAPWHAQAFALAVALNEAGHFDWAEWAEAFGAELATRGQQAPLDGSDDYFTAWIATLETIATTKGFAGAEDIAVLTAAWREAYLTTPHGQPVRI